MKTVKISIPKMNDTYQIYVYRSKHSEDINTIEKIRTLKPIAIIDSSTALVKNGHFIFYDKPGTNFGITYMGPVPNTVPCMEYSTEIKAVAVNKYTFVNNLILEPLPIDYQGTMLYYSCIGVDEANNMITHLSKVSGVLVDTPFKEGTRHLYSCNNYTGTAKDKWEYIAAVPWDEEICMGDMTDKSQFEKYGCPVIETVPTFRPDDVMVSTRPVPTSAFGILEIPNPWYKNNRIYNYRRMKAYRVCNVYDEQYSEYSEPTYQAQVPVSIEKMVIMCRDGYEGNVPMTETLNDETTQYTIIRRDGLYYKPALHKNLGLNKYNIPLEENLAVFNEASVQEKIKKQVKMLPAHVYSFSIYMCDVYGHWSDPVDFIVRT